MTTITVLVALAALALGALLAWLFNKNKVITATTAVKAVLATTTTSNAVLSSQAAELQRQIAELKETQQQLTSQLAEKEQARSQALQTAAAATVLVQETQNKLATLQQKEHLLLTEQTELQQQFSAIKATNAALEARQEETMKRVQEQQAFMEAARQQMKESFGALSADALKSNNESFVALAQARLSEKVTEAKGEFQKKEQAISELVKPLSESLKNIDTKIQDLEGKRIKAYSDIWNHLEQVKLTTEGLKKETTNLVGALKTSHQRGRYGELALRRLVEHAGLFEHCDFEEQVTVEDEQGRLRPDMIIKLPGNRTLVVDSKVPLAAYLRMFETDDAMLQQSLLAQHVLAMKDHLKKLSAKAYWSQFTAAPDFVIMYVHIESSYGAALQAWPEMIEEGMKNRIIIATPTVLLSILMGVGYSWNQLTTIENIEAIRTAAVELHDRSATLVEHMANMGKSLNSAITHYNKTVGSMEAAFLPQARKIHGLSQAYTKKQLPDLLPVETAVRAVTAPVATTTPTTVLPFSETVITGEPGTA